MLRRTARLPGLAPPVASLCEAPAKQSVGGPWPLAPPDVRLRIRPATPRYTSFERFRFPGELRFNSEQAEDFRGELLDHLLDGLRLVVEGGS